MTALKSFLYLLVVQNFGFYIPLAFCRSGHLVYTGALAYLAFILWPLGILGLLWCFWNFTFRGRSTLLPTDPPRELVVSGLYWYVSNPIYVSVILILLGHFLQVNANEEPGAGGDGADEPCRRGAITGC